MKITTLKKEIEAAIKYQADEAAGLNGSENPQTVSHRLIAENMAEAFTAVLNRINGDRIALSFYGK